jgi:hypothetical protein
MLHFEALRKLRKSRDLEPDPQRQIIVEEYAALDREIENYRPRLQRHEKLRQLILDWYPHVDPNLEITVPGISCEILISARDIVRSITPEGKTALYKLWGLQGFIAKAHIFLKLLPDPKDPEQLYTVQALTGPRHLHVVAKATAAANPSAAA